MYFQILLPHSTKQQQQNPIPPEQGKGFPHSIGFHFFLLRMSCAKTQPFCPKVAIFVEVTEFHSE